MSGAITGLGKVFQSVGSTVAKVTSSVGAIGKSAFTALTAQAAPSLAQGGATAITGYSNSGVLGNVLGNAVKQTGYGSIDAAQAFGQSSTFAANGAQVASAVPQVAKPSGFGALLNNPIVPGLLQGLGQGLNAQADRKHETQLQENQINFQQKTIDDVRDSYNVSPEAYGSSGQPRKPRFQYDANTGKIEHV